MQFDPQTGDSTAGGLQGLRELSPLAPLWQSAQRGLSFPAEVAQAVGPRMRQMSELEPLAALARLLGILSQLSEIGPKDGEPLSEKQFALAANRRYAEHISRAIQLIVDHYAEDLNLDDISQAVGLNRVTLCRYFRRYTGRSVIAFLNGVRIDHARRQLISSGAAISQIAMAVGYGNLSHFNRQFAKAAGETPSAFRKRHGN